MQQHNFAAGDRVEHSKYGPGTVIEVTGDRITVRHDRHGEKRIMASFLQPSTKTAPTASNDNKPDSLPVIHVSEWQGVPVPEREWLVPDLVPLRQVTLLSGDGGVGKSLLALQLSAATALGYGVLGLEPRPGRVLYVGAEDEAPEFQRRLADILNPMDVGFANLHDRFDLVPLAGRDAALVWLNPETRQLQATPLFAKLVEKVESFRPTLLVLDTSADLFAGNEIDRVQVRTFVGLLRSLAMEHGMAVLLLSHPSVAGMQNGSGLSGSTAWNNSVRSRLYLTTDKDDDDLRILKTVKANYGRKGDEVRMRWHEGAFILDDGKPSEATGLLNRRADEKFREMLSAINRTGQRVAPTKGVNYAPSIMAVRPDAGAVSKKQLEAAMHRLLAANIIKVVWDGPPSKQRQRLIVSAEDFGPEGEMEAEAA